MKKCPCCGTVYSDEQVTCLLEGETLKPILNRPLSTTSSQLVMVCASLTMLGIGVLILPIVIDDIKNGQTYSLTNLYWDTTGPKVSREASPVAFWMNTGLHIAGVLIAFILPIFSFREVIIEHKRKIDARKKQPSA